MATTWQDRSADGHEGASVRVAHSTMHRIKDTWFEYIGSAPAQSEAGLVAGDLDLKTADVDFKVRKGADQEVERPKDQAEATLALASPGFMVGEAFYLDGVAQGRCSCEIRA